MMKMPYVFRISLSLIVVGGIGGQILQAQSAAPVPSAQAAAYRARCPGMGGPREIASVGDKVRFYDAYVRRSISEFVGLPSGCKHRLDTETLQRR